MHYWRDELERFIATLPYCVELTLNVQIHNNCFDLMARYALRSLDAVHLATALRYEIPVFWTCDDHFERVNDLYVEVIRDNS
jgi:predicted nucleic acid-binding protein